MFPLVSVGSELAVQQFHCPALCPWCVGSSNTGLAIQAGQHIITVVGPNVTVDGSDLEDMGRQYSNGANLNVSRMPKASIVWPRRGISDAVRVQVAIDGYTVVIDSQEYRTPNMATGYLQNMRVQIDGNLFDAAQSGSASLTGMCTGSSVADATAVPREQWLFPDATAQAMEEACGMVAGGLAENFPTNPPTSAAEACAMSNMSAVDADDACAILNVDEVMHEQCMYDFCAMRGDDTALVAALGAGMDQEPELTTDSSDEDATTTFTLNVSSCPDGSAPSVALPVFVSAQALVAGPPICVSCDIGFFGTNQACVACPAGQTTYAKGSSSCSPFPSPPFNPPRPPPPSAPPIEQHIDSQQTGSDEQDDAWVIAVVAGLLCFCCCGLATFLIARKKRKSKEAAGMVAVDIETDSSASRPPPPRRSMLTFGGLMGGRVAVRKGVGGGARGADDAVAATSATAD